LCALEGELDKPFGSYVREIENVGDLSCKAIANGADQLDLLACCVFDVISSDTLDLIPFCSRKSGSEPALIKNQE
jgi:hypothetical protein